MGPVIRHLGSLFSVPMCGTNRTSKSVPSDLCLQATVISQNMAAFKQDVVKKLEYTIHTCSSFSSTYVPE
jgi:hypothetical protein